MIKNYSLLLVLLCSCFSFAQENLTFSMYDGAPATVTATTSTVNDILTITFEDVDIVNNFYTEGRTYIHMYGGLDTSAGGFQGAPTFGDLASQPQLTLLTTDTDANAGPNTYSITINLAQQYSSVPDGTTIFGFNLLFQNEFGGGGNNQTADLYVDLVDALKDSTLSTIDINDNDYDVSFFNNNLSVKGYKGNATINVFDINGKQVINTITTKVNSDTQYVMELPKKQLLFIVFETRISKKTIKTISTR